MKLQKLYSKVRQALDDYNMITENDKIAIGVSGGKDSLTLLYALAGIRSFYPIHFELAAIAVDLGYDDFTLSPVQTLCDELGVDFLHSKNRYRKDLARKVEGAGESMFMVCKASQRCFE